MSAVAGMTEFCLWNPLGSAMRLQPLELCYLLAVTICAIVTLFVLTQLTARVVFAGSGE